MRACQLFFENRVCDKKYLLHKTAPVNEQYAYIMGLTEKGEQKAGDDLQQCADADSAARANTVGANV